VISW